MAEERSDIRKLIEESLSIEAEAVREAGATGYMARVLVQATMPHSKPDGNEFVRKNGSFTLSLLAPSHVGLPYGALPRLLICWVTTEAVRTKERELVLGNSLSAFMRTLDLVPTGGRWGSVTRLKDQMKRLFASSVTCSYDDGNRWALENVKVVDVADLWWDPKNPDQVTVWESTILLGERFFTEVIESPVPIDMRALKALRRSPLALDIYCWVTYRMSYLKRPTEIPWEALQMQLGTGYPQTPQGKADFKRKFLSALKKVAVVYPELKASEGERDLILKPSPTHVPKQPEIFLPSGKMLR